MTCPHASTTTVAWLHGEGDDAHAAHVASCPDCLATSDAHVEVLSTIAPVTPALRAPERTRSRRVLPVLVALAAAAVALGALGLRDPASTPPSAPPLLLQDDLDVRLDDVHADVVDLSLDLGPL